MRLLIVEDEEKTVAYLRKGFSEERFAVDSAHDGSSGLYLAETVPYDAIVLMMPSSWT